MGRRLLYLPWLRRAGAASFAAWSARGLDPNRAPGDDPDRWSGLIDEAVGEIAERRGLDMIPGKLVWELGPRVHADKGDAVPRVVAEVAGP